MFISPPGSKLTYRYISSVLSMNLSVNFKGLNFGCTLVSIEGAFIGKYFMVLREDENNIALIEIGKGNFYGNVTEESAAHPVFEVNKSLLGNDNVLTFDKYRVEMYSGTYRIEAGDKTFENCFKLEVKYLNRQYVIYLKDGVGVISVKNLVNGRIKDEIVIKE